MTNTEESEDRQELARAFAVPEGDARHQALETFVRDHPEYAEGHLYLGVSYLLNRFSATLELPMSVIVLGGARTVPTHAPSEMVAEHLRRAEEHCKRAMELDAELTVPATSNIAALKLAGEEYDAAIDYIEELMRVEDRSEEPVLRQHLGTAYRESGEYERALELFQSIIDSEATLAHRNLALTYLRRDEPVRADEEMRAQLGRHDSELDRKLAAAVAAELRGDAQEARSAYGEIAEACRFDSQNQLLGVNARRRRAKLAA